MDIVSICGTLEKGTNSFVHMKLGLLVPNSLGMLLHSVVSLVFRKISTYSYTGEEI